MERARYDMLCQQPMTGRYVEVSLTKPAGVLTLCELEVIADLISEYCVIFSSLFYILYFYIYINKYNHL